VSRNPLTHSPRRLLSSLVTRLAESVPARGAPQLCGSSVRRHQCPSVPALAILAALILASPTMVLAGVNVWTPLGPEGGQFFQVAVDPASPSTLWATGLAGAFKSSDGGGHWAQLFSDRGGARGIATAAGTVLLVDVSQQIRMTTDGGSSWSLITNGLPALGTPWPTHLVVFNPADPSVVYLERTDGLHKSTDGGASWATIGAATLGTARSVALFIDPASPATLWTWAGKNGIKKSTDGGLNWSPVNTGLPTVVSGNVPLFFFAADPLAPANMYAGSSVNGTIYRSGDGGVSWAQVVSTLLPDNLVPLVVPGHSNVLYAGGSDPVTHSSHLYKSTDGGASWVNVTGGIWTAVPAPLVAIPGGTVETVYASLAEGLYASTDAGASWHSINTGLHGLDVGGLAPAATTPTTTWYFHGGEQGIWKSADGGATFSAINGNLIDPWNGAIVVDPGNPQIVYAAGQTKDGWDINSFVGFFHGFVSSTDGGASWLQAGNPDGVIADLQPWGIAVVPASPTTILVAAPGDGAFKSVDGGINFSAISANLPLTPYAVFWHDIVTTDTVGTNLLIGDWNSNTPVVYSPYRSTDGGASWGPTTGMPSATAVHALVVDPANRQTVYAGTTKGLFKTTDGGATAWQAAGTGMPAGTVVDAIAVDPNSDPALRTIYAAVLPPGSFETVYRSTDGAGSWSPITRNGFDIVFGFKIAVDPANSQHLVVAGRGGLREITLDPTDTQNKGVSGAVESGVPSLGGSGSGDGNGDGIADTTQANVASLPSASGSGYVTVAAPDDSGVSLFGVEALPGPAPASAARTRRATAVSAAPPGVTFPDGLVQFSANNLPAGGCVAVTLYFPRNDAINAYYKYGPTIDNTVPHWYKFTYDGVTGAQIFRDPTRTRIVLHLCDGLRGDSDVMANGVITDPGGPVIGASAGPFFTLPPCRVLDTRNPTGPLGAPSLQPGATRTFDMAASTCGIPVGAVAISANLAVTNVGAPGELVAFASDVSQPNTSVISFRAGRTRANNAIVSLSSSGTTFSVFNSSAAPVDFILDVNGFFR
jgi:hypothetical protein